MDRSNIGIIIPAYNEEATIQSVIKECHLYGTPIVVDDGSTDQTSFVSENANAKVVKHSVNRGYDSALNSGFRKAASIGCKYIITIDADGQHDPEILQKMISLLEKGFDMVIGVRNQQQRFSESIFSFITRKLYGILDPLCGLKAYHVELYNKLGYFDSYKSIGTELLLFTVRNDFKLAQIPIVLNERNDLPRFGSTLKANYKILRAILLAFIKK